MEEVGSLGGAVIAHTHHMSIEEADCAAPIEAAAAHVEHVQLGNSNRLEPGAGTTTGRPPWRRWNGSAPTAGWPWSAGSAGRTGDVLPGVAELLRAR